MHLEAACLSYGGLLEMVLGMGIVGQVWRGGLWRTKDMKEWLQVADRTFEGSKLKTNSSSCKKVKENTKCKLNPGQYIFELRFIYYDQVGTHNRIKCFRSCLS